MKILIDPMLAILAKDLSIEDKAELLMCILQYPNRDCALGLWKYIRQQIDADAQRYKEKCERMAENAKNRWSMKSNMKSNPKSDTTSLVIEEVIKENKIKNNEKVSVSSNELLSVDKYVDNFLISTEFSFNEVLKIKPKFANYLSLFPQSVVERAEKTIIQKRFGQTLSIVQILEWLEQENQFYKMKYKG